MIHYSLQRNPAACSGRTANPADVPRAKPDGLTINQAAGNFCTLILCPRDRPAMTSDNPYQSTIPEDFVDSPRGYGGDPVLEAQGRYGGMNRLTYFLSYIGLSIASNVLQFVLVLAAPDLAPLALVVMIASFGVLIYLIVQRLKNLGYSGLWALALVVPLLNLLLVIRCLAAPEGYADHKTLDTAGKVIVGVILGLFVLAIGLVFLGAAMGP